MQSIRPTVRELQRHGATYPDWQVCPTCRGGRGEVIPILVEETNEPDYIVLDCSLCHGDRVIPKVM